MSSLSSNSHKSTHPDQDKVGNRQERRPRREVTRDRDGVVLHERRAPRHGHLGRVRSSEKDGAQLLGGVDAVAGARGCPSRTGQEADRDRDVPRIGEGIL